MLAGVGIDRIEIDRVRSAWQRHGERMRRHVYTDAEWAYCLSRPDPASSLAARFAAKEAVMKALGRGWGGGIHFRQIEVTRALSGAPGIRLHDRVGEFARVRGVAQALVSLTHDRTHAMAFVILEKE